MLLDRYRIEDALARGGMGLVYLAVQLPLERKVAIKLLNASENREAFRRRFLLEASSCARLSHRHIVTVHDYGQTEDGDLFMAMEYIDGESLARILKREPKLSPLRACHIATQITRALRAAHGAGVVHRDLKPSNVMITQEQEDEDTADFVKVVDFGLAKLFEAPDGEHGDLTRSGAVLGSPRYMAPEQIRSGSVDPRTDIYSVGVLLFRMVTGEPPFDAPTTADILSKHLRDTPPSFGQVAGAEDLPLELELIVKRCLEKDPGDRYQSANDLLSDLKATIRLIGPYSLSGDVVPTDIINLTPTSLSSGQYPAVPVASASSPTNPTPASPSMTEPGFSEFTPVQTPQQPPPKSRTALIFALLLIVGLVIGLAAVWNQVSFKPVPTEPLLTVRTDPAGLILLDRTGRPLGPSPIQVEPSKVHVVAVRYEAHDSALMPLLPKVGAQEVTLDMKAWISSLSPQAPPAPPAPVAAPSPPPVPPVRKAPPPRVVRRKRSKRRRAPPPPPPQTASVPVVPAPELPLLLDKPKDSKVPLLNSKAPTSVQRLESKEPSVPMLNEERKPSPKKAVPMLDTKDPVPLLEKDETNVKRLD